MFKSSLRRTSTSFSRPVSSNTAMTSSKKSMLSRDFEMLLINLRIAINVAVFTLASSPEESARISTILPSSSTCTFNLSFDTTNSRVNRPSESSAR